MKIAETVEVASAAHLPLVALLLLLLMMLLLFLLWLFLSSPVRLPSLLWLPKLKCLLFSMNILSLALRLLMALLLSLLV
jgi:hypothetical protein